MKKIGPIKKIDLKNIKLLNNRLFLIVAGLILFLAVAGGVYSVLLLQEDPSVEEAAPLDNGNLEDSEVIEAVEVLPQQRRESENEDISDENNTWSAFNPQVNPFGGPMKLTGVLTGDYGGAMAIIESGGTSFIVAEGDYVDDLWSVHRISLEQVVLRAHDQEVTLFFDKSPETRSLGTVNDEDDPEEDE